MSAAMDDNDRDLLRQMVRQVLRDVVPQTLAQAAASAGGSFPDVVSVSSDAELLAFAQRIARACADSAEREAIIAGQRTFRLLSTLPAAAPVAEAQSAPQTHRVERGAVTERHVREAAESGAVLVLGKRAVLTPLARDRARAAGVEITKER